MRRTIVAVVAVSLAGCATAMHRNLQEVPVASTPAGATVRLDCGRGETTVGSTPTSIFLHRSESHCKLTLSKSGWRDAHIEFRRMPSPAALGNAVPALLAGVIVATTHVNFGVSNGASGGAATVSGSASGSGSISPAAVAGVVFSGALLVDLGSGALYQQSPGRVDVTLEPNR
jgi:hypothetical protein